jgi:hypothetical protein
MALFLILPWIPYGIVRMSFSGVERSVHSLLEKRLQAATDMFETNDTVRRLQEREKAMHEETGALFSSLRIVGPLADSKEYEEAEEAEDQLLQKLYNLREFVQSKSRVAVVSKYGRRKRQVVFDLDLPNELKSTFTVQLTDPQNMPYSIHLFLAMVESQVWEGHTMLHRGDLAVGINSKAQGAALEEKMKSTHLLFVESSDKVSRGKHSVCFSGVGPSFYISLEDRPISDNDPCFGAVVENNGLLARIPQTARISKISLVEEP